MATEGTSWQNELSPYHILCLSKHQCHLCWSGLGCGAWAGPWRRGVGFPFAPTDPGAEMLQHPRAASPPHFWHLPNQSYSWGGHRPQAAGIEIPTWGPTQAQRALGALPCPDKTSNGLLLETAECWALNPLCSVTEPQAHSGAQQRHHKLHNLSGFCTKNTKNILPVRLLFPA